MTDEELNEHKGMIQYFHERKGDIERYTGLDEALKYLPELNMVYQNYKIVKMALDNVITNLTNS